MSKRGKYPKVQESIIVIDTNLLLLFLIGLFDKSAIKSFHQRLSKYTIQDYEFLVSLIKDKTIIITPNILTEISNLSLKFNRQMAFFEFLRACIPNLNEQYINTSQVIVTNGFIKFGLTDATLIELSKKGLTILTDDFPLFYYLANQQFPTINFTQLRTQYILK